MEDGPERPGVVVRTGAGLCKRKVTTRSHVTIHLKIWHRESKFARRANHETHPFTN